MNAITWDFGRDNDLNYDRWPDGWQRRVGRRYPKYVEVAIAPKDQVLAQQCREIDAAVIAQWPGIRKQFPSLPALPPSVADRLVDQYLRITLDGGMVMVQSEKVNASSVFQYRFTTQIMTKGLRYSRAKAELVFEDDAGNELEVHATDYARGTSDWTTFSLNFLNAPDAATKMFVRLIVDSADDGLEDIRGEIGFDNVRIEPFPHLQLVTDNPLAVYRVGDNVTATAIAYGLPKGATEIYFRIHDCDGEMLQSHTATLGADTRSRFVNKTTSSGTPLRPDSVAKETPMSVADRNANWTLPRLEPGFYRITATLGGEYRSSLISEATLAIIDPRLSSSRGVFGWTLPTIVNETPAKDLVPWLSELGVRWVKYPSWVDSDDDLKAAQIADVFSRLQDAEIQTIGMLDIPPEQQIPLYDLRSRRDLVASQLLHDPAIWQPLLEPVMTRLTLKVRRWQLGADRDFSFLGRSQLPDTLETIAKGLQGYGQPLQIALSWPWTEPIPEQRGPSWQDVSRSSDPALTADELDAYLTQDQLASDVPKVDTWVLLGPIAKSKFDRDTRILDLILRMATVRKHPVQAAFVSQPIDPEHGLLTTDARPDELLLPWRTTSHLIGGLKNVGSLKLRSKANSLVFENETSAVLMVWSREPTEELMYLGDQVQAVDVWGKVTDLYLEPYEHRQVQRIKIGPLPTFLVGVDPELLAFRGSVEFKQNQIDSFLGQVQPLGVTFTNACNEGIAGTVRIRGPETWSFQQSLLDWELLSGSKTTQSFDVVLGNSAKVGQYELAIDFELQTNPPKQITVYREVDVGPFGLEVKAHTKLLPNGQLHVQVEMTNRSTQPQAYDCMVFPQSGRQYERRFIRIAAGETARRDFFWSDGRSLVGSKMLLRAGEENGRRIMNLEIPVME